MRSKFRGQENQPDEFVCWDCGREVKELGRCPECLTAKIEQDEAGRQS